MGTETLVTLVTLNDAPLTVAGWEAPTYRSLARYLFTNLATRIAVLPSGIRDQLQDGCTVHSIAHAVLPAHTQS